MVARHVPLRARKLILWIAVPVAVVLVLATVTLLVVNIAVVPGIIARAEAGLVDLCRCEFRVERARYFPLRGIVLRGVVLDGGSMVELQAARVRIKVPLSFIRRRDDLPDLAVPNLKPWNATSALMQLLADAGAAEALPRKVIMDDVLIVVQAWNGASVGLPVNRLEMLHDSHDATVSIASASSSEAVLASNIQIGYGQKTLSGELELHAFPLTFDPITTGEFDGHLSLRSVGEAQVDLAGEVELQNVTLELPSIADEPISNLDIRYQFAAALKPHVPLAPQYRQYPIFPPPEFPKGELIFSAGALQVNQIGLSVVPTLRGFFRGPAFVQATIHLPETPVQEILESVPVAISGKLADATIAGTLAWDLDLQVPLDAISEMEWTADTVVSGFAVQQVHPSVNVYDMNDDLIHTIDAGSVDYRRTIKIPSARPASMEWMLTHSEHTVRQIERIRARAQSTAAARPPVTETSTAETGMTLDPEYRYTYVDDLSPWIIRAVLTAEDGDFFFYGGINWVTLAAAIERNIQAGEILYGASTISMQLVKMLFLDHERIFSRKLQELFLVYLMEHQVPVSKERILELYLNIAEFGPGVSGIYDASRYYFDRDPRDLTAGEATWLASILPSPKTYHQQFVDGSIDDDWFARMIGLYDIMVERGRMTHEEDAEAVRQRPEFAR